MDNLFSVVSVREKRAFEGHFLSLSSYVKDLDIKRQARNKYSTPAFFEDFLFSHSFCSSLFVFHLSVGTERGRGWGC